MPKDQLNRSRRIAVIGPLPPVKSGVARHTAAVATELSRENVTRVWAYRRQYPSILYPGASETSPESKPVELDHRTILDGVNPLTWRTAAREIIDWKPDLLVLPAWTFFLAPSLGWIARKLRKAGVECCMIVHNAFDHETAPWKTRLSLWQLAQADRFVTHNHDLADAISAHFPERPIGVFPHPVFGDLPPANGNLPREARLELLFFGLVRPYKGLDILLEAFARSGRSDAHLAVVGEFWQGREEAETRIRALGLDDRVTLVPRFVSDAEAAGYFERADVVVLPYLSVTGSGVVPTAYHYGRPVIASDLPGLSEVVQHGQTGWLSPAGDIDALAQRLASLTRDEAVSAGQNARSYGMTLNWERLVEKILEPAR